jgi:hypothetical protein
MSLPRSRSHNGPTNPRNKSQLKVTRKRNSRSKRLRQSAVPGADRPHGPGGLSVGAWGTVRGFTTNRLKKPPEPLVLHLEKRTVRPLPTDHPHRVDCSHSAHGLSAKLRATKSTRPNGSNERRTRTHEELDELPVESLLADHLPVAHEPSAWCAESSSRPTS